MADEGIKRLIELGINATPAMAELKKLGDETAKQTAQLDGLQGQLTKFGTNIAGALSGLAIGALVSQAVDGIKRMIDEFDHLTDAAQSVGLTVERVQEL